MQIKNHQDFWAGILFVAAGSLFVIGATAHDVGDVRQPGPAFFPLLSGGLMIVLGCLVNFKAVTFETDDGAPIMPTSWRLTSGTLLAVLLSALLLPAVGLLPTIALQAALLGIAPAWLTLRRWLVATTCAVLACWLFYGQLPELLLVTWPQLPT